MELKVVEGFKSEKYNHFKECRPVKCEATDTRYMGVVALKIEYEMNEPSGEMTQLLHLDFSEYGIDEYNEIYSGNWIDDYEEIKESVEDGWNRISGSLGGKVHEIKFAEALFLIDEALKINEIYCHNHDSEILSFRDGILLRVNMMREAYADEYKESQLLSTKDVINSITPLNLSAYEVINYFLMRMLDNDLEAAATLTDGSIDISHLKNSELLSNDLCSLIQNKIVTLDESLFKDASTSEDQPNKKQTDFYRNNPWEGNETHPEKGQKFECHFIAMSEYSLDYYFGIAQITTTIKCGLFGGTGGISSINVSHMQKLSLFEAACQFKSHEYISTYDIKIPPEDLDFDSTSLVSEASVKPVPNGMQMTLYNKTNSHVNSANYNINDDIFGAYLVTLMGEIVIMSTDLHKINAMERDLAVLMQKDQISMTGRYLLDTQIFQSFCEMPGAKFSDIIIDTK